MLVPILDRVLEHRANHRSAPRLAVELMDQIADRGFGNGVEARHGLTVRLLLYAKDEGARVWPRGDAMPQRNWLGTGLVQLRLELLEDDGRFVAGGAFGRVGDEFLDRAHCGAH